MVECLQGGNPNGLKTCQTCTNLQVVHYSPVLTVPLCKCPGDLKD